MYAQISWSSQSDTPAAIGPTPKGRNKNLKRAKQIVTRVHDGHVQHAASNPAATPRKAGCARRAGCVVLSSTLAAAKGEAAYLRRRLLCVPLGAWHHGDRNGGSGAGRRGGGAFCPWPRGASVGGGATDGGSVGRRQQRWVGWGRMHGCMMCFSLAAFCVVCRALVGVIALRMDFSTWEAWRYAWRCFLTPRWWRGCIVWDMCFFYLLSIGLVWLVCCGVHARARSACGRSCFCVFFLCVDSQPSSTRP